jgi:hypothetical protein
MPQRQIARSIRVSQSTVSEYLNRFEQSGLSRLERSLPCEDHATNFGSPTDCMCAGAAPQFSGHSRNDNFLDDLSDGDQTVAPQSHPTIEDVRREIRFIADQTPEFALQNADFLAQSIP